tara:strand:- start:419 stop:868 length:450 start_codon:yes stop_codon:yes gene_type:complete
MSFDLRIIEGDIELPDTNSAGEALSMNWYVNRYDFALQQVHKILLSPIGESRYHPGYGSSLSFISSTTSEPVEIAREIEESVYKAISNLIALQQFQVKRQLLDPEEMILEIKSVDVFFDSQDPRLLNVVVKIILGNLTEMPASVTVRIQ